MTITRTTVLSASIVYSVEHDGAGYTAVVLTPGGVRLGVVMDKRTNREVRRTCLREAVGAVVLPDARARL